MERYRKRKEGKKRDSRTNKHTQSDDCYEKELRTLEYNFR